MTLIQPVSFAQAKHTAKHLHRKSARYVTVLCQQQPSQNGTGPPDFSGGPAVEGQIKAGRKNSLQVPFNQFIRQRLIFINRLQRFQNGSTVHGHGAVGAFIIIEIPAQ